MSRNTNGSISLFLSTPSARRATIQWPTAISSASDFYPRPPRGGRRNAVRRSSRCRNFYPRPPRGGRPAVEPAPQLPVRFLSTPSARRATARAYKAVPTRQRFLSTPSARRATNNHAIQGGNCRHFYPRPPRGGRRKYLEHFVNSGIFLSTPSARRATAKTERKPSAFVSLYTSLHKLQRDVCKPNRKITSLLAQTAGIPVRSVPENHVCCRFALAGHQKISTLSWANSGCSPTCSTLVW